MYHMKKHAWKHSNECRPMLESTPPSRQELVPTRIVRANHHPQLGIRGLQREQCRLDPVPSRRNGGPRCRRYDDETVTWSLIQERKGVSKEAEVQWFEQGRQGGCLHLNSWNQPMVLFQPALEGATAGRLVFHRLQAWALQESRALD